MKKLLLLLLLVSSCSSNDITIPKDEYYKLKGVKTRYPRMVVFPDYSNADRHTWTIVRGSDGHDYMENSGGNTYIMMHYIECEKCKSGTSVQK